MAHPRSPHTFVPEPSKIRRPRLPREAEEARRISDTERLEVGGRLVWEHLAQRRKAHRQVAFVLAAGRLQVNGEPYDSPSDAADADRR